MDSPKPYRILVVDDEEPVRMVCTRILAPLGYSVESAATGEEALLRFEKEPYDLLITDFRMPGNYSGLDLGRAVKERHPDTHIILMTAFPAVDTAVETLRLGASDYLIKPFDHKELINRVRRCFEKPPAP